jgi:phosphate transporter
MWTIVFLAMGGIALGKGVVSSGLLEIMDVLIRDLVDGFSLYSVVLILSPVVLVRISLTCYGLVSLVDVGFYSLAGDINFHQPHNSKRITRAYR